jgi:NTE family protein
VRLANLNALGAELVTDLSTGQTNQVAVAYLQPLDAATKWYLSPSIFLSDQEFAQYENGERLRELRTQQAFAALALARQFGTSGAAALSLDYGVGQFTRRSGPPIGAENDFTIARYIVDVGYDTVDDLYFPTTGDVGRLSFTHNLDALGSSNSDITLGGRVASTRSRGQNRLRLQFAGGTLLDGEGADQNAFTLGGLFFLSGYPQFELSGQHYVFASLAGYRDIGLRSVIFDMPIVVGGTVETGRIWNDGDEDIPQLWSGSLVVGVDAPVGPLFIAYGVGGADRHVFHFSLGQEF